MKDKFNAATRRDQKARDYFSSDEFLDTLRTDVKEALVNGGGKYAIVRSAVTAKPQDLPYIEKTFRRLREEYPELDHIRLNRGFGARLGAAVVYLSAPQERLIVDTRKNRFHRRIAGGGYA